MAALILDAGPIVALFDRRSAEHAWVTRTLAESEPPAFSCQPVISEAIFLMRRDGVDPQWLLDYIRRGAITCAFDLDREIGRIRELFASYKDRPISLADACLVRMSELHEDGVVMTLDRDFLIYRRQGRRKIPLLAPFV